MRKTSMKAAVLAAMVGSLSLFGGCLSLDGFLGQTLWQGAMHAGFEFALDNDAVFDLFEDGDVTSE